MAYNNLRLLGMLFAILKECTQSKAIVIAERIRNACESFDFGGYLQTENRRVTVSVGIASFPHIRTAKELIRVADEAFYKAKIARNCVEW